MLWHCLKLKILLTPTLVLITNNHVKYFYLKDGFQWKNGELSKFLIFFWYSAEFFSKRTKHLSPIPTKFSMKEKLKIRLC